MADYLILKRDPASNKVEDWKVVALRTNKTADADGAKEAMREGYTGSGSYAVLRADNATTLSVVAEPKLAVDATPQFA